MHDGKETVPGQLNGNSSLSSEPGTVSPSSDSVLSPIGVDFPATETKQEVQTTSSKHVKKKRSALFYPSPALMATSNQAPYSRSAAKRDSIKALGSIEYLQHLYTKQGLASRTRPPHKGAVIAIGPAAEAVFNADVSFSGSEPSIDTLSGIDESFELPPSPKASTYKSLPHSPSLKLIDIEALKAALIKDLQYLLWLWGLREWLVNDALLRELASLLGDATNFEASPDSVDFTNLLEATSNTIRSVRDYILALPSILPPKMKGKHKDGFRRQSSFCGASRPGQYYSIDESNFGLKVETASKKFGHGWPASRSEKKEGEEDHLAVLRKSALAVLSVLRDAEHRISFAPPIEESKSLNRGDGDLTESSQGSEELGHGMPFSTSPQNSHTCILLADLNTERETVQQYLRTVDKILSCTRTQPDQKRLRKIASTIEIQTQAVEDSFDHLSISSSASNKLLSDVAHSKEDVPSRPVWASKQLRETDLTFCIRSFIVDTLETSQEIDVAERLAAIVASATLDDILHILADGYILCKAFNAAVSTSDQRWGFIQTSDIHDPDQSQASVELEAPARLDGGIDADLSIASDNSQTERRRWTFRRADNLRAWAAALRLRYAINSTSAALPVSLESRLARRSDIIEFDPGTVARKHGGWQTMLVRLISTWIAAIANEL